MRFGYHHLLSNNVNSPRLTVSQCECDLDLVTSFPTGNEMLQRIKSIDVETEQREAREQIGDRERTRTEVDVETEQKEKQENKEEKENEEEKKSKKSAMFARMPSRVCVSYFERGKKRDLCTRTTI